MLIKRLSPTNTRKVPVNHQVHSKPIAYCCLKPMQCIALPFLRVIEINMEKNYAKQDKRKKIPTRT